jgi:ubiquitin carboxyl-terminal hydrolase 48
MEDFYELELNIKGLNNLEESLNDYFSEEALDGENQYFCESCQKRVDATHCIKLRSLPPVVNFQLKRYVFLPKVIYLYQKLIHSCVVTCSFTFL